MAASASDPDDWGPPRNPHSDFGFNCDDVVRMGDSDREIFSDGGQLAIRHGPKGSQTKLIKMPIKKDNDSIFDTASTIVSNSSSLCIRDDCLGLFVYKEEKKTRAIGTFSVFKDLTEPNYADKAFCDLPINTMDGLKRARVIKESINKNISILQPLQKLANIRLSFKDEPENKIIQGLRNDQDMAWSDIANFLNQECRNRGETANFTATAVYCRYVRCAPQVAISVNEIGFDPKDYMHLRHPNQYTSAEGTCIISKAGKKRVKNYNNAKELECNIRHAVKEDDYGDLETAERTEQLMQAVAVVERNFWILVADEMERTTTKLYPADRLASRFHAV